MVKWFESQRTAMQSPGAAGGAWRCAGATMLALVGFIALNMAGCGGGGGGGGSTPVVPAPTRPGPVLLILRDINGNPINGSVTLSGNGITPVTLNTTNGRATFPNVKPGTYSVRTTINGTATTSSIVVTAEAGQNFVVSPAGTGQIVVSGRILINPGDPTVASCGVSSLGVSARVSVRVRDLNTPGQPIIASYIKPDQSNLPAAQRGTFSIPIPRPATGKVATYRITVRPAPATSTSDTTAPFAGSSVAFTVASTQTSVTGLNVCANQCNPGVSVCEPGGTPPPPPGTPTPIGGPTVTPGGPTVTPGGPTVTPGGPTVTPGGPTVTPGGPTVTPGGVPTPTTAPTSTPAPTATPVPTNTPGGPTPSATNTPVVNNTPAPTNTPNAVPSPGAVIGTRSRRGR